jgi:hypothetical protein
LLETFVACERFAGTSFRAAHGTCVGETVGRGKRDRLHHRPITSFTARCPGGKALSRNWRVAVARMLATCWRRAWSAAA